MRFEQDQHGGIVPSRHMRWLLCGLLTSVSKPLPATDATPDASQDLSSHRAETYHLERVALSYDVPTLENYAGGREAEPGQDNGIAISVLAGEQGIQPAQLGRHLV
jgi:hypothetical protein